MQVQTGVTRRTLLQLAAGAAAAVAVHAVLPMRPAQAAQPASNGGSGKGERSPNGWRLERGVAVGAAVWPRAVLGSEAVIDVRIGDVEAVLLHVARRFHYDVDTLEAGDAVGFMVKRDTRRGYERNHSSGTAIDLHGGKYPAGIPDPFDSRQFAVIRAVVAECEGVVRWGGDFKVPAWSHFEIAVPPDDATLPVVADKLRLAEQTPGLGAGVLMFGA